ncbi:hypothetical protein [Kordiimonas sp. SCSIO 12610]|uniref:hypothetical protein n=1 Tax=Kordiimonas sp. SCSIO 12610 TaxID=2829597 RepID=UPI00210CBE3D|nr:hypothetical protein [Kordiimonas sp. SCSIO 12610]UTW55283.1 hypothetical protein KFF44_15985 [Kordiimonas sp. SCSIO 12610]
MIADIVKFFRFLFWLSLAVILVIFSVNNRHDADLSFDPLFSNLPPIPVYMVLFAGIFIGITITGLSLNWLRLKGFTKRRQAERAASTLEDQVSTLSEDLHNSKAKLAHENTGENVSI